MECAKFCSDYFAGMWTRATSCSHRILITMEKRQRNESAVYDHRQYVFTKQTIAQHNLSQNILLTVGDVVVFNDICFIQQVVI